MDRCGVFVDAGWFLSESAQAVTGKGSRWAIECDYGKLTAALGNLAQQITQLPLLRIYWYDAAVDGIPTADHLEIARLKDVKLRLGRISHNQQKGVDALCILDLTTLARARAIASALVISGDEDIREGIATAQGLGVRVTIGSVAMVDGRSSLATTLLHEADDYFRVDIGFLTRYFRTRSTELVTAPVTGGADTNEVDGARAASEAPNPRQFGYQFGATHANELDDSQLRLLQREAPEIPSDVAARLFREAERVFGETRGRPELRRELRMGFWDHVMHRRNG
jgi:uncharacterized LabA/DUF88 family protein